MITKKQKEIAARLVASIGELDPEVIRQNIRDENEYCRQKEESQTPTPEQMQREFTI